VKWRGEGTGAMSGNYKAERDPAQAARWAEKWRKLELEAVKIARAMRDPDARRHMLFISEAYRLLAERAESRRDRLVAPAAALITYNHLPG
jgi:hypothetical protein